MACVVAVGTEFVLHLNRNDWAPFVVLKKKTGASTSRSRGVCHCVGVEGRRVRRTTAGTEVHFGFWPRELYYWEYITPIKKQLRIMDLWSGKHQLFTESSHSWPSSLHREEYNIDTHSFLQSYVCINQTQRFIITAEFKLLQNKLLAILLLIS